METQRKIRNLFIEITKIGLEDLPERERVHCLVLLDYGLMDSIQVLSILARGSFIHLSIKFSIKSDLSLNLQEKINNQKETNFQHFSVTKKDKLHLLFK